MKSPDNVRHHYLASGSADEVYIELLTGERKSGEGLIAQQIAILHNRKKLEEIGFSEGIGFIPFAGTAWHVYRTVHKENPNPVRAVAATYLAHDHDPASARALVRATDDRIGSCALLLFRRLRSGAIPRCCQNSTEIL